MILELAVGHSPAARCFVISPATARDNNNAAAAGTRGRLDDEFATVADQLPKTTDVAAAANNGIRFGDRDTVLSTDLFCNRFVVDKRIQSARVAGLNECHVALVDAEHSSLLQLMRPGKRAPHL